MDEILHPEKKKFIIFHTPLRWRLRKTKPTCKITPEHINPLCKQNFPNQFWIQGMLNVVCIPLAQSEEKTRIKVLQRLLLYLKNLNAWPTVWEQNDLLYFLPSTVTELKIFNVFVIFFVCLATLVNFCFAATILLWGTDSLLSTELY